MADDILGISGLRASELIPFIPIGIIALVVGLLKATHPVARSLLSRLIVFVAAVGAAVTQDLLFTGGIALRVSVATVLLPGVVWLIIFEYLSRKRFHINRRSFLTYLVAVWFVRLPLSFIVSVVWMVVAGGWTNQSLPVPQSLLPPVSILFVDIAFTAMIFGIVCRYAIARADTSSWTSDGVQYAVAHGGIEMSPSKTDTTRLLSAAAVLNGTTFRHSVLERLRDANRAAPPELGLDVRLLAEVCTSEERRGLLYEWGFMAIGIVSLVMLASGPPVAIVFAVLACGVLYFCREYQRRYALASYFAKDMYDPDRVRTRFSASLDPEVSAAIPDEDQNLIVYRGFTPFVGAGINLGGWSFVVNLDKPKDGAIPVTPQSFDLEDLYEEVDHSLNDLALDGMVSLDTFFVNGTDVRNDREILPHVLGKPHQTLSHEHAMRYLNSSDSRVRHYRWYRVHDWSNELIVSQFFRCARRGRSMFIEINRYLLTPVADKYRAVDALPPARFRHVVALGVLSLFAGLFGLVGSAFSLMGRFNHIVEELFNTRARRRRQEISDNPLFDYGAAAPMRQEYSSDRFIHYFQKVDGDSYNKLFDREVLDAICQFLDAHNIDTSDIRERQNVIMNSGIIVQGGDVRAESLAVGAGAMASKTSSPQSPLRRARKEKAA